MYLCCKNGFENDCQVLLKASKDGKEKIVEELIKAGADVAATDEVKYISGDLIHFLHYIRQLNYLLSQFRLSLIFTLTLTLTVILTLALTSVSTFNLTTPLSLHVPDANTHVSAASSL